MHAWQSKTIEAGAKLQECQHGSKPSKAPAPPAPPFCPLQSTCNGAKSKSHQDAGESPAEAASSAKQAACTHEYHSQRNPNSGRTQMSLTLLSGETLHVQAQHSDWQLEPSSRNAYFSQGRARQAVWEIVKPKVVHHLGNTLSSLRVSFLCRLRGQTSIRP